MDSPPTGSNVELVYLKTKLLSITIKGSASHPRVGATSGMDLDSIVKVGCADELEMEIAGLGREVPMDTDRQFDNYIINTMPLFFEQQNYEFIIEKKPTDVVTVHHDNASLRNKISAVGRAGTTMSGMVNFGNEIGYSDFSILVNGKPHLQITLEVYPSKISYKEDYKALLADVTDEVYGLVYDLLKKTYQTVGRSSRALSSSTEFFSVITELYDKFILAIDVVLRQPHHELKVFYEVELPPVFVPITMLVRNSSMSGNRSGA